jgi:hypothetical protein
MGTRRQFSRELKLEAVRLVKDRDVSVAQAARDLDVHESAPPSACYLQQSLIISDIGVVTSATCLHPRLNPVSHCQDSSIGKVLASLRACEF